MEHNSGSLKIIIFMTFNNHQVSFSYVIYLVGMKRYLLEICISWMDALRLICSFISTLILLPNLLSIQSVYSLSTLN
ncbi:uncharacterized protein RJT21DRAFT_121372 [Scheffersomyces amazonensis]|uniref:uncharacterized protein n=1 Tax=Scheffersomyces amazonensis TaxID=1078765 RepID=UPI00315CA237